MAQVEPNKAKAGNAHGEEFGRVVVVTACGLWDEIMIACHCELPPNKQVAPCAVQTLARGDGIGAIRTDAIFGGGIRWYGASGEWSGHCWGKVYHGGVVNRSGNGFYFSPRVPAKHLPSIWRGVQVHDDYLRSISRESRTVGFINWLLVLPVLTFLPNQPTS